MEKQQRQRLTRQAKLVLEDGSEYAGWAFGKSRSQAGEVVFSTGMGGYAQTLTDPGCRGQIIVATYPLQGNCGVPVKKNGEPFLNGQGIPVNLESALIHAAGYVVSEICGEPDHYTAGCTLAAWLEKGNTPGIYGIDTRALAVRLRERGIMRGKILVEGCRDVGLDSGASENPVADVSHNEIKVYMPENAGEASRAGKRARPDTRLKVALVDCGVKANIIRCLLERNVEVIRVPWNHDLSSIAYDGLFLSSGPGDPKGCGRTIAMVRKAFTAEKPVFGIGLGGQIMALAAGADTYKLLCGHHGQNQPCVEKDTGRCYITSQHHSYAIRGETLPRSWEPWFTNAHDGTIEGIRSVKYPFSAVQFHPEGCPGPQDTAFLFDRFIAQIKELQK